MYRILYRRYTYNSLHCTIVVNGQVVIDKIAIEVSTFIGYSV